jgi:hypothetical protein
MHFLIVRCLAADFRTQFPLTKTPTVTAPYSLAAISHGKKRELAFRRREALTPYAQLQQRIADPGAPASSELRQVSLAMECSAINLLLGNAIVLGYFSPILHKQDFKLAK